jgi:glycine/D-amino acid oxidase-like deaminating enzyme
MQESFEKRLPQLPAYLSKPSTAGNWEQFFTIPHGLGIIHPALLIDLNRLLNHWQAYLLEEQRYEEATFRPEDLEIAGDKVMYQDITADRIIFCDGAGGINNPYFSRLPFTPNKGEALLVRIDELPATHIYKKGFSLVPYPYVNGQADEQYFWVGSTYENRFTETGPTAAFRERTVAQLQQWLKLPFSVLDHWAAIRPATVERRPFAGMHPRYPQIGILNGTGTKGCSLAPWLARQLAAQIHSGSAIQPEASIERFGRILAS